MRLSEPDLRTPEQLRAAREASRPPASRRNDPLAHYAGSAVRNRTAPRSPTKADV